MHKRSWLAMAVGVAACSAVSDPVPTAVPDPVVIKTVAPPTPAAPTAVPSAAPKVPTAAAVPTASPQVERRAKPAPQPTPHVPVVTAADQKKRVEARKLQVRPIRNEGTDAAIKAGKQVGPVITFAGAARADGKMTEPIGNTPDGVPIYLNYVGSGFMMVIEGKPGFSNLEAGRSIFRHDPEDPNKRPDLQVQVDRPLGDGSEVVCDARPPKFGGIPAISPADFSKTQRISNALNDMACRFETFIESDSSCTVNRRGEFSFHAEDSTVQFCMVVARLWRFPEGDTTVSIRLRDREGNPGPVSKFVLRRQPRPTRPPASPVKPTPTPVRRRP